MPPATIRAKRRQPETNLQRAVCQYLGMALPKSAFFFAVPNGGWRTKTEAGIMRATGAKAGVPDLMIIFGGKTCGIELKSDKGVISPAQTAVHQYLLAAGAKIAVCRSLAEVQAALDLWDIPLSARVFGFQKQRAA